MIQLQDVTLGTNIMLAPMAGVTNPPFRQLCREFGEAGARAAGLNVESGERTDGTVAPTGLYVCEMITARALVERNAETMMMIQPDPGDPVRSIQLYGVEPKAMYEAARILVAEDWADHIDMNFGCPVPKVTRKGGGSALPWKFDLYEAIIRAVREGATAGAKKRGHRIPVTTKFRIGIDANHETFEEVAQISKRVGLDALTLHARTTVEHYSGSAHWERISQLKEMTDLPVFGNGDVFEAEDALAMLEMTGADGVVVGRGCQGRPWLFFDLVAALNGSSARYAPTLSQVADVIMRHAQLSIDHFGGEMRAMREMRKHIGWYLKGYSAGGDIRQRLALVESYDQLGEILSSLNLSQPYPDDAKGKRGRTGHAKKAHLPDQWLESHFLSDAQRERIHEAEIGISGG
ncbi:tRNA dihydrouridine synthase DusB [Arcanobacterium canis]